jgi:hypothetical protein
MYGSNTLPNTGAAAVAGAGLAFDTLWLALLLITIGTLLLTVARLTPRREV